MAKVFNEVGSKERLFEMFNRVNKTNINESFDVPEKKDKEYLDNTGDSDAEEVQPQKYDGDSRYPVEDNLNVKDKSLEKVAESEEEMEMNESPLDKDLDEIISTLIRSINKTDTRLEEFTFEEIYEILDDDFNISDKYDMETVRKALNDKTYGKFEESENLDEISMAGLKSAGRYIGSSITGALKSAVDMVGAKFNEIGSNIAKAYYDGKRDEAVGQLEKLAQEFGEDFATMLNQVNDAAIKAGDQPVNARSLIQTISNSVTRNIQKGQQGKFDLGKYKSQKREGLGEAEQEEIEGGLADGMEPMQFDSNQILQGMEVEMEHTDDPKVALEIAMDHLQEDPEYYTKLAQMESGECDDVEMEEPSEEESLLNPQTHWENDYVPKKLGENIYDPEAGEDKFQDEQDTKRYLNLEKSLEEMKKYVEREDWMGLSKFVKTLPEIPYTSTNLGDYYPVDKNTLQRIGVLDRRRGDEQDNISDKNIVLLSLKDNKIVHVEPPVEKTKSWAE